MHWNLEELRDLVNSHHGASRAQRCWNSLQSIRDRQDFAGYHFREFKRLIQSRFPPGRTLIQELDSAFRFSDDAWANHVLEFEASAHVVACLQSMHCVSDTLGQVVYLALGPRVHGLDSLGEHGASIKCVRQVLERAGTYPNLASKIAQLCDHKDFKYLSNVVNHGKHRRIVSLKITVDTEDGPIVQPSLELSSFEHNRTMHPERNVQGFLNGEYSRQSCLVVDIGNEVNKALAS